MFRTIIRYIKHKEMIRLLDNLPPNVVGIEVDGEVTRDEYDTIVEPNINKLAESQQSLNYIVVLKSGLGSFTAGVWWEDFKLALKHYTKWNKVAIVTDEQSVRTLTNLFGFGFPGKHKIFNLNGFDNAVFWVSAAS